MKTTTTTTAPHNFATARNTGRYPSQTAIPETYRGNPARGIVLGFAFATFLVWPLVICAVAALIGGK